VKRSLLDGLTVLGVFLSEGWDLRGDVLVRAWCADCGVVQDGLLHARRGGLPVVVVHCVECGAVTRHLDEL
jgi:hypothetical protein